MLQKRFIFFFAACFIFLGYIIPFLGFAQTAISLYPIKFRVTVAPGASYADTVTVNNPNDVAIIVRPEVENVSGGEEGSIDLIETEIPHGLMAWIAMDRSEFSLAAHEQKKIPFSITVPLNGTPGGHYGALLFRVIPAASGAAGSGVSISSRVGSVVLVEVPGETKKTGSISDFLVPPFVARGPIDFSFKVENTGNSHFDPQGSITVSGPLAGTAVVNYEPRIVFPGHARTFKAEWPVQYLFGPITATLSINIPDSGMQTAVVSFWAFPWQEASVIVGVLLVIWFTLHRFKKNFKIVRVKS